MYTEYFGLSEAPFSIAPNPHYLYMSPRHSDALAHLLYGVQSDGGFILLTGEVGTGKTTLCKQLLSQIPEDVETAFVLNPRVTVAELLATICDEFGIQYDDSKSIKVMIDALNAYLLDSHANLKKAVLIIDEAQNLSSVLLEQLRLLTNLETTERKLLQIILLGQPELLDMLARPELRQFNQRVTARFHLQGLNQSEANAYISHRLDVAGGAESLIDKAARRRVFKLSQGIPRVMNLICDRALLGAYAEGKAAVNGTIVSRAAKEVLGGHIRSNKPAIPVSMLAATAVLVVMVVAAVIYNRQSPDQNATTMATTHPGIEQPVATLTESNELAMRDTYRDPVTPPVIPTSFGHRTMTLAYHDLFALWGSAFVDKVTPPCELAANISLGCHELMAPLSELLHINRPVIIEHQGRYMTLSEVVADEWVVIAADQEHRLNREQFDALYNGRAYLFWRMPPAYRGAIKLGDLGPSVDWLNVQFAVIDGNSLPSVNGLSFTATLQERVKQFQFAKGLPATGEVTPITWIHLNSVEAANTPLLRGDDQLKRAQRPG